MIITSPFIYKYVYILKDISSIKSNETRYTIRREVNTIFNKQ